MSFNLASQSSESRQVIEDEKSRLYEFWQRNLEKAKGEAIRIAGEKGKRKGQWKAWAATQIDALSPPEYQAMVKRELERLA